MSRKGFQAELPLVLCAWLFFQLPNRPRECGAWNPLAHQLQDRQKKDRISVGTESSEPICIITGGLYQSFLKHYMGSPNQSPGWHGVFFSINHPPHWTQCVIRHLTTWIHFGGNQKLAVKVVECQRYGLLSQMDPLSNLCAVIWQLFDSGVLANPSEPQCVNP